MIASNDAYKDVLCQRVKKNKRDIIRIRELISCKLNNIKRYEGDKVNVALTLADLHMQVECIRLNVLAMRGRLVSWIRRLVSSSHKIGLGKSMKD